MVMFVTHRQPRCDCWLDCRLRRFAAGEPVPARSLSVLVVLIRSLKRTHIARPANEKHVFVSPFNGYCLRCVFSYYSSVAPLTYCCRTVLIFVAPRDLWSPFLTRLPYAQVHTHINHVSTGCFNVLLHTGDQFDQGSFRTTARSQNSTAQPFTFSRRAVILAAIQARR